MIRTLDQKELFFLMEGDRLRATLGTKVVELKTAQQDRHLLVSGDFSHPELASRVFEYFFNSKPDVEKLVVEEEKLIEITREEFFQTQGLWNIPSHTMVAELWNRGDRPHPIRNDRKDGLFYQRYSEVIRKTITFRGIDPEKDLETFHRWHNQPRVSFFWELAQSKEELLQYLLKAKSDPHLIPVFVELDGTPVGYFEFYWTLEDRLGPYYEADAFDRGFHFLIGEKEALGYDKTNTIVRSALHFLFLDDVRTRRVMAEPRHDNKKVLRYAETSGWKKLKEFDFPHKRAALLECKRENFFNGQYL